MRTTDPYETLGVKRGATREKIKAAFRAASMKHHQDRNRGQHSDDFIRVAAAYEWFEKNDLGHGVTSGGSGVFSGFGEPADANSGPGSEQNKATSKYVLRFIADCGIEFDYNGDTRKTEQAWVKTYGDMSRAHKRIPWDDQRLMDEVIDCADDEGVRGITSATVGRALPNLIRQQTHKPFSRVMDGASMQLSRAEIVKAQRQWERFMGAAFAVEIDLGIAVLQHFIYQVKAKAAGEPGWIGNYLVPVIWHPDRRMGKTSCVQAFLPPIRELCTDPTLFKDFEWNKDRLKSPVVFIDDSDHLNPNDAPTVKQIITGEAVARRGSKNRIVRVENNPTAILSINDPIHKVVKDEEHARFFVLPFINENPAKGGDPKVWKAINATDFPSLWRSVNALEPAPIKPFMARAYAAH